MALAPILILSASVATLWVDCDALYEKHLASDLSLSWEQFDQTEASGFRVLAAARCPREAGNLIEAYLAHNNDVERQDTLEWHLAQMRAEAGQTTEAIAAAKRSLRADEKPDAAFKWNAYVSAVIAFLEKDSPAFDRNFAVLAAHDDHPGNVMNLSFLKRLAAKFDASYGEALSSPATSTG